MKKKELSTILNDAVEIFSEVLLIGETVTKVAKMSLKVIGTIRTVFCIPDEPDVLPEKEAPTAIEEKPKKEDAPAPAPAEVTYTKEDVRKLLAGISNAGHRDEVKALLTKYGAETLTKLDPANYADIMADAEAIRDDE